MNNFKKLKAVEARKKQLWDSCEDLLARECLDDPELKARYKANLKEFVALHREAAELQEAIGWKLQIFLGGNLNNN